MRRGGERQLRGLMVARSDTADGHGAARVWHLVRRGEREALCGVAPPPVNIDWQEAPIGTSSTCNRCRLFAGWST